MSHGQIVATVTSGLCQLKWPVAVPAELAALGARCLAMSATERPTFSQACKELEEIIQAKASSIVVEIA